MNVIDITKDIHGLAEMYQKLPANGKEEFWKFAKETMDADAFNAFATMFAYLDWLMNPTKMDAIKLAMAETLYVELNGGAT